MVAFQHCFFSMPNSIALCSFTKPLNDPGDLYPPDTLPCRQVQTQAEFIAHLIYQKLKDSVTAVFDSLYKAKCFARPKQ